MFLRFSRNANFVFPRTKVVKIVILVESLHFLTRTKVVKIVILVESLHFLTRTKVVKIVILVESPLKNPPPKHHQLRI